MEKFRQASATTTVTSAPGSISRARSAAMNTGADEGAMPVKLSENIRPTVIAGLAKLVDAVNQ
jgi:hypothetical protein